jgi:hypothetical protein
MAVLSIVTGGGKWVERTIPADSLYQHLLPTAEKKFWRCVFAARFCIRRPVALLMWHNAIRPAWNISTAVCRIRL